jgi:hypothetical protein
MEWPEEMIWKSRSFCSIKSKQGRAGYRLPKNQQGRAGQSTKKITGQGRIQVIKILAGQVTGYKNTLTCRALIRR